MAKQLQLLVKKEVENPPKSSYSHLPPMLRQYRELKDSYPDFILLFQVGDFYEVFFEDSKLVADTLSIRLTARNKDPLNPIPMCGVPIHAVQNYVPKLLEAGLACVLVSQTEEKDAQTGARKISRSISRIVTPGVRYADDGLDEASHNFLAAVKSDDEGRGVVVLVDVSTSTFRVEESFSIEQLKEIIWRSSPREFVLPVEGAKAKSLEGKRWQQIVVEFAKASDALVSRKSFSDESFGTLEAYLAKFISEPSLDLAKEKMEALSPSSRAVVLAMLAYLDEVSFGSKPKLNLPELVEPKGVVGLDSQTIRNLEIFETQLTGSKNNSLFNRVNHTTTAMGARLLQQWILAPLRNLSQIEKRLDAVGELVEKNELRESFLSKGREIRDLERLLSKLYTGSLKPSDAAVLRDSIKPFGEFLADLFTCRSDYLTQLSEQFDPLDDVFSHLSQALVEEPPAKLNEGGFIQSGFNSELDNFRDLAEGAQELLLRLEKSERDKTQIPNLKIKYNGVFGYFFEVTKTHKDKVPSYFIRKQTLVGAERYVTEELSKVESDVINAKTKRVELEKELFNELKEFLLKNSSRIQLTASIVSQIDVLASFASCSVANHYVRPRMLNAGTTEIEKGRHPVVEQMLPALSFQPNNTSFSLEERSFLVLTGPNMGGKSTYLRQIGIIQILAQAGCFVPAEKAELGVVDRVFTRLGAADDLSRGDSTFMVEMREAASILKQATRDSLVLIDEIGRGTSTLDGLSLARAVAEHLIMEIGCRTVFATHFHELHALTSLYHNVASLHVGVLERCSGIEFTHRVSEGASDRSFGLEVARLAGLPGRVISRALKLQAELSKKSLEYCSDGKEQGECSNQELEELTAEKLRFEQVLEKLESLNLSEITPLQALNELADMQDKLKAGF